VGVRDEYDERVFGQLEHVSISAGQHVSCWVGALEVVIFQRVF
jgi:hypothetical protein